MPTRIVRRLIGLCLTVFLAALVVFAVLAWLPGDPAAVMLGVNAQPDTLAALRAEMGLNQPLPLRFAAWFTGLLQGDLGTSYTYSVPVAGLIWERLGVSLPLAMLAILLAVGIGVPLGALAAAKRGSYADLGLMTGAQLGVAVPNFWLAILLIFLFAVTLGWLPSGGFPGWGAGVWAGLKALLLPGVALALPQAAILARLTRSSVLEALGEDYILTARMKGLSRQEALWRHALPNAMIPVVTVIGLQLAFLLAGTIIVENVFYLPGLGRLLFQAIAARDLVTVQGLVVLLAIAVIVINFLVDLAYLWLDPRIRDRGRV